MIAIKDPFTSKVQKQSFKLFNFINLLVHLFYAIVNFEYSIAEMSYNIAEMFLNNCSNV